MLVRLRSSYPFSWQRLAKKTLKVPFGVHALFFRRVAPVTLYAAKFSLETNSACGAHGVLDHGAQGLALGTCDILDFSGKPGLNTNNAESTA